MCYTCAERNKLRRVFSTAIDLVKAPVPTHPVAIKTVSIRRRVFMRTVVVFNQTEKFRAFRSSPTCLVTTVGMHFQVLRGSHRKWLKKALICLLIFESIKNTKRGYKLFFNPFKKK